MGTTKRYTSIDLLRGIAIIAMLLVTKQSPFAQLRHGTWYECTLADLVYPAFLLIIGVSMALSSAATSDIGALWKRMLKRVAILFAIGVFLLSLSDGKPRFNTGTLQSIAFATLLAFSAVRLGVAGRFLYGAAILAALTLLASGDWSQTTAPAVRLDILVLGKFKGVEGIAGSTGAAAFIAFGLAIGEWLRTLPPRDFLLRVVAFAALALAAGVALMDVIPFVSRLVSPSFALQAVALLSASGALVFYLVECTFSGKAPRTLTAVGENALAVYIGVKVFKELILSPLALGNIATPIIKIAVAIGIALYLRRKKIRIRL